MTEWELIERLFEYAADGQFTYYSDDNGFGEVVCNGCGATDVQSKGMNGTPRTRRVEHAPDCELTIAALVYGDKLVGTAASADDRLIGRARLAALPDPEWASDEPTAASAEGDPLTGIERSRLDTARKFLADARADSHTSCYRMEVQWLEVIERLRREAGATEADRDRLAAQLAEARATILELNGERQFAEHQRIEARAAARRECAEELRAAVREACKIWGIGGVDAYYRRLADHWAESTPTPPAPDPAARTMSGICSHHRDGEDASCRTCYPEPAPGGEEGGR